MLTRDFLKLAGLSIAHRILPPSLLSLWAQAAQAQAKGRKVILVTFGGGVRTSETFAPEGLRNIPRLSALRPEGFFYQTCQNQGVLSHFNSTASIVTGNWQRVDDFGFEAPASATIFENFRRGAKAGPLDAWVIATNKSFASMGASSQRDLGLPFGANVVLPKQLLLDAVKDIVKTPRREDLSDRDAVHRRLETILQEGYEGVGWTIFKGGRQIDRQVHRTLTRALGEYINGPEAPTSGDELTFFITREVMREFAPRLLLVNFWDMDVAHWGSYSLYLQAITRTDRLTGMLWDEIQTNPKYKDQTTMLVLPELGRDGDVDTANGFLNHRSGDPSCRNTWLLALGVGVTKGQTDKPIRHVDVAATAAAMLNVKADGMVGIPAREILV
ncbi:MAG: hypothetical protein K2X03_20395 [Bryobacteraceae bacterium]|nr:hypothetical protein [Bryobacteraceae bacterium]